MKTHEILVLEDSLSDQLTLEMILEQFPNLNTIYATNSEEFFSKISENNFQLVILDIVLKEALTGLELAKYITNSSTWLIICSAHNCEMFYDQIKTLNLTKFYIQKPIDEFELKTHLDSFIFSRCY